MSTSNLEKGYGAIASGAEAKPTKSSWRRTLVALAAASVVVVGATAAYSAHTGKKSKVISLMENFLDPPAEVIFPKDLPGYVPINPWSYPQGSWQQHARDASAGPADPEAVDPDVCLLTASLKGCDGWTRQTYEFPCPKHEFDSPKFTLSVLDGKFVRDDEKIYWIPDAPGGSWKQTAKDPKIWQSGIQWRLKAQLEGAHDVWHEDITNFFPGQCETFSNIDGKFVKD